MLNSNEGEIYTSRTVCDKLGFTSRVLQDMREDETLVFTHLGRNHIAYDAQYVDELAALWAKYPPALKETRDVGLFTLFKLQWEHKHPPTNSSRKEKIVWRRQIAEQCRDLVAKEAIYPLSAVAVLTGQKLRTVQAWRGKGSILALRVGNHCYVSQRYGRFLRTLFSEWNTLLTVQEKTGISAVTLYTRISMGRLEAVRCPDKLYRVAPAVTASLVKSDFDEDGQPLFTFKAAAQHLRVPCQTIRSAALRNQVVSVGQGRSLRIPWAEFQKWDYLFNHLNPGFAWLEPLVLTSAGKPHTVPSKQAARVLGITESTLARWCEEELLPFFLRSFSNSPPVMRDFLRLYLFGLRKYADPGPVPRGVARQYLALCKEKNQVI